jgi:uncharacterized protein YjbI with pentapeptide repeats
MPGDTLLKKTRYLLELREANFSSGLRNKDFNGVDFSMADFHGMQFVGVNFEKSQLDGLNLYDCELVNCSFRNCDFTRAILKKARILNCLFDGSNVSQSDFGETIIYNARIDNCDFHLSKLTGAKLIDSFITKSNFLGCDFAGTFVNDVEFFTANLQNVHADRTVMVKCKLVDSRLDRISFNHALIYDSEIESCETEGMVLMDTKTDLNLDLLKGIRAIDARKI